MGKSTKQGSSQREQHLPRGSRRSVICHCPMGGIILRAELNKRKVRTPRGGAWHPQLVKRIQVTAF